MRFLAHGEIHADALAAMTKHEQKCEPLAALSSDADEPGITESPNSPQTLLPLLQKKQLQLLTTDTKFIADLYEQKILFPGVIVLLLESTEGMQADAIDRLFERYPRLSPRRLYTVTGSRVKIRQLPGAAQAS
jgi:hypothetical protein